MINYRLDTLKKPSLKQRYEQKNLPQGSEEEMKLVRLMLEDKRREADKEREIKDYLSKMDAMHEELEAQKALYKALQEQKLSETELFNEMKRSLIGQLHESGESVKRLTKEVELLRSREQASKDDADMSAGLHRTMMRDMEAKLSQTFGKLAQSEKQNRALMETAQQKPQAISGAARVPSFEFTPVKDRDGRTVKLIATPIGD